MSSQDFLTLEEAAKGLQKSVQTVRRMIKRGEIPAKRVKTPQGFNYVVNREDVYVNLFEEQEGVPVQEMPKVQAKPIEIKIESEPMPSPLPIPMPPLPETKPVSLEVLTENEFFKVEPFSVEAFMKIIELQHKEKMMLIHILEKLQEELNQPAPPSPGFFERLKHWFLF